MRGSQYNKYCVISGDKTASKASVPSGAFPCAHRACESMELAVFASVLVKCIVFIELVLGEAAMAAQDAVAPVPIELLGGA